MVLEKIVNSLYIIIFSLWYFLKLDAKPPVVKTSDFHIKMKVNLVHDSSWAWYHTSFYATIDVSPWVVHLVFLWLKSTAASERSFHGLHHGFNYFLLLGLSVFAGIVDLSTILQLASSQTSPRFLPLTLPGILPQILTMNHALVFTGDLFLVLSNLHW